MTRTGLTGSKKKLKKFRKNCERKNTVFWAIEVVGAAPFVGFVELHYQNFPAAFTPCIEIGWRLAYEHWRKGYAFEAASKGVEYAFQTLKLSELVSFTHVKNQRSRKLMEKLGMTRRLEDDFEQPKLGKGHPLRRHVLDRLKNQEI